MGPSWGPPGSCQPQMGPILAPWTLLSGILIEKEGVDQLAMNLNPKTSFSEAEWCIYASLNYTIIGSDNGLSVVTWMAPSHYLNECWSIVNWTLGNKLHWNLNRNFYIFIQENAFENVLWKMAAILSWPQCVNRVLAMKKSHTLQ